MDKELSKRWLSLPEIGIDYQNIFTVNNEIINLPDISPEILADYIEIGQYEIDSQLRRLREEKRYSNDPAARQSILMGRLAVSGGEDWAFSPRGLKSLEYGRDIVYKDLAVEYRHYWMEIDNALYTPEVHHNIFQDVPTLSGTWLGLRRP